MFSVERINIDGSRNEILIRPGIYREDFLSHGGPRVQK